MHAISRDLQVRYSHDHDQTPRLLFTSCAASIRQQRLLNSVVQVKVFCKCKGFEKRQFYKINKEFRHGDLVLKQNFQLSIDQSSLSYKAVPTWHLQLVYWWWRWVAGEWTCSRRLLIISYVFLNCNYGMLFACFDIAIESWGLFTCARATRILTAY